jgi:hypothetical protein
MFNHSPFDSKKIKKLLLISIAGNIIFLFAYEIIALVVGIGTYGVFCFLVFLPVLNVISLIMDLRAYFKMKNPVPDQIISTLQFTAILEIGTTATGNIISLITGVLILTNLEKASIS